MHLQEDLRLSRMRQLILTLFDAVKALKALSTQTTDSS
jgi:hypothetical protein